MHAHTHPALFNRPIDDADLAQQAIDFGMRGFVLKDHDQATMGRAYHVSRTYPETSAFGAIVLNRSVGGINPYVVQAALQYGAKHRVHAVQPLQVARRLLRDPRLPAARADAEAAPGPGVTVFDESGALTPEALRGREARRGGRRVPRDRPPQPRRDSRSARRGERSRRHASSSSRTPTGRSAASSSTFSAS